MPFSEVAAVKDADRCNAKTLKNALREFVKTIWPSQAMVPSPREILRSCHSEKVNSATILGPHQLFPIPRGRAKREAGRVPRASRRASPWNSPDAADSLTVWVKWSFIPFYELLTTKYPVPTWEGHEKLKKYVLAFWIVKIFFGSSLNAFAMDYPRYAAKCLRKCAAST